MGNQRSEEISNLFKSEYKNFLQKYLFKLLGFPEWEVKDTDSWDSREKVGKPLIEKGETIYFAAQGDVLFEMKRPGVLSDDNIRLAKNVIEAFFAFSEHTFVSKGRVKNNRLITNERREKIYNMAIQVGICRWITDAKSDEVEALFNILEQWAVKTYEGRQVTMGFVIDPKAESYAGVWSDEWMDFLRDDYAAVISDCIHSVFELDQACNFIGYRSISESPDKTIPVCQLNELVPLRFLHIINQFVPKEPEGQYTNKVGIFLLSNGDILLAKNGAIRFVKRNMRWLNLSYDAFKCALQGFVEENYSGQPYPEELISSVYASVLDVSFSHTGGIIAIVTPSWEKPVGEDEAPVKKVLNQADNLRLDLDDHAKKAMEKKQAVKRKILCSLIGRNRFMELDRKLRSELIALDGACIMDLQGALYSFGAIIQNNSGSSGGARAAAAKKLAESGVAIKISTDGYIEVYSGRDTKYVIK